MRSAGQAPGRRRLPSRGRTVPRPGTDAPTSGARCDGGTSHRPTAGGFGSPGIEPNRRSPNRPSRRATPRARPRRESGRAVAPCDNRTAPLRRATPAGGGGQGRRGAGGTGFRILTRDFAQEPGSRGVFILDQVAG